MAGAELRAAPPLVRCKRRPVPPRRPLGRSGSRSTRCSRSARRGRRRSPRPRGGQLSGGRVFSAAERGCGAAGAGRGADSRPPPRRYSAQQAPLPPPARRSSGGAWGSVGPRARAPPPPSGEPGAGTGSPAAGSGEAGTRACGAGRVAVRGRWGAASAAAARRWRRGCGSRIRFRGVAAS